ncbi:SDR family NAD(P)-dependent oxidoreductase [Bacillus sp. EB01]|uniref:SDR family NAD(P)-dependent oxidoreductase n=1 Tax=Bacillus sp. EB01 TaxID=1347086 RepID=UPI0005C64D6D|nr:SDR family NAD(P)-dependent oxidoreductase [Bacillus sp. EB01]
MARVVFVTGANRGLGLGLVRRLLEKDCMVFAGIRAEASSELEQLKAAYSNHLEIVAIDVTDSKSIDEAKVRVEAKSSKLDWLINNAAILGDTRATVLDNMDFGDMMSVFDTNTLGPLRVANVFLPLLLKSKTKLIVNISSEAGSIADCHRISNFGYCMSKAALNMQSALVHNHLKEYGGGVLIFHPGWVQTYMQGKLDTAAPLTADESASKLVALAEQYEYVREAKPLFLDYLGNRLQW